MRYTLLADVLSLLLLARCGSSTNPPGVLPHGVLQPMEASNTQATETDVPTVPEKRSDADVHEYLVGTTRDVWNAAQVNATAQFLQSLTSSRPKEYWRSDGQFLFYRVNMTLDQSVQAERNSAIAVVEYNTKLVEAGVLPVGATSSKGRRDVHYSTQELVVPELAAISQPSGVPDLSLFKNYVYESNAGSKSFIYHLEYGVAYKTHPAEFPKVADAILTPEARKAGRKGDADNSGTFHSTCTADKAVGQQFGVAKKATLIPVIMAEDNLAELTAAFEEIALDLKTNHERPGFSVVSLSLVTDGGPGRQAVLMMRAMRDVMRTDVPVVAAAGNFGGIPGREKIDTFPALFASKGFPLIVVGSTSPTGAKSVFSQEGDELTSYAVGEGITCFEQDPTRPTTDSEGTSFSAPMVAGQIANLLSYDKVPFDTSSGNLVTNARDYIKSNPAAGWERRDHARVLWNGVTEADNARYKTCTDIMANKYVARETLRSAIEDDFCNKNLNAPVSIRYHEGSMEDVTVHLEYYHDNPDPSVLTQASCRQNLLEITDGCSIPDVHDNPLNFKAGGVASLGGATYRIEPQSLRQPASRAYDQDGNGCNCVYKFWYDDFTVWGHGWISEDFGVAFREKLKAKCSLNGQTWTFNYGLGDDGREWTAWFRTTVFQSSCVSGVAKEFGANEDFNCNSG